MLRINQLRKQSMHIPVMQREKAAILYLRRRFGYSINVIAKALGRSRSLVHRILKFNAALGMRIQDLRKIPRRIRELARARQWSDINRYLHLWEMFLLGELEKPP